MLMWNVNALDSSFFMINQFTSTIEKLNEWYFFLKSHWKVHCLIWSAPLTPQVISKLGRGGGAVGGAALATVPPGRRQHDEAAH